MTAIISLLVCCAVALFAAPALAAPASPPFALPPVFAAHMLLSSVDADGDPWHITTRFYANFTASANGTVWERIDLISAYGKSVPVSDMVLHTSLVSSAKSTAQGAAPSLMRSWQRTLSHRLCSASDPYPCQCHDAGDTVWLPQYIVGDNPTYAGKALKHGITCNVWQSTSDAIAYYTDAVSNAPVAIDVAVGTPDFTGYYFEQPGAEFDASVFAAPCATSCDGERAAVVSASEATAVGFHRTLFHLTSK